MAFRTSRVFVRSADSIIPFLSQVRKQQDESAFLAAILKNDWREAIFNGFG